MDDLTTKIGIPGIAGLVGMLLGWAGVKPRLNRVEQDLRRGEEKFDTITASLKTQGESIARMDGRVELLLTEWQQWKKTVG